MKESYNFKFSRNCYYVFLGIIAVFVICIVILYILQISVTDIYPYPCLLFDKMWLYCPGCGGTRAVDYLIKGEWLLSFKYHPVVLYSFFFVTSYVVSHTLNIFTKGKIKAMQFNPVYFYVMIAIILIQCIIKNILVIVFQIHLIL